jgi:peptidoglycan hydrolase CwlO-like protein
LSNLAGRRIEAGGLASEGGVYRAAGHLVKEIIVFAAIGLIGLIFFAYLASLEQPMSVSEKLNLLQDSVTNVTTLIKNQSAQIADLKSQIAALQSDKAQSEDDAAKLQTQIDALNALTVPVAPPAQ